LRTRDRAGEGHVARGDGKELAVGGVDRRHLRGESVNDTWNCEYKKTCKSTRRKHAHAHALHLISR
jgi:hypothetical protein